MTASHPRKSDRRTRCLSTGHGRARPDIRLSPQIVRQFTEFDATAPLIQQPFHHPPACWSASTPFTHLIRGTQIPIAQAAPPTLASDAKPRRTSRGFLVWGFFCQGVRKSGKSFVLRQFLCSISKPVSSSRPALRLRCRAQKLSRLAVAPTLRHTLPLPGHTLTASSTTARLVRSG